MPRFPFTVKENIDLVGAATTQGLKDAGRRGDPDRSYQLSHSRGALAHRKRTVGATLNPWDRSRTPGASSGGEAAALATGMSTLGLGNDMLIDGEGHIPHEQQTSEVMEAVGEFITRPAELGGRR